MTYKANDVYFSALNLVSISTSYWPYNSLRLEILCKFLKCFLVCFLRYDFHRVLQKQGRELNAITG